MTVLVIVTSALIAAGPFGAQAAPADPGDSPDPSEPYFTIAVIPDTQYETGRSPKMLKAQMTYLRDHVDDRNIVMVLHEGDIVDNLNSKSQWATARKYFNYLDGVVPTVFASGNHDLISYSGPKKMRYHPSYSNYDKFLRSFDDYEIDGQYKSGNLANTYRVIDVLGSRYLVLSLEFGASDGVLTWAKSVAKRYSDATVILLTHDYLNEWNKIRGAPGNGSEAALPDTLNPSFNDGYQMWSRFVKSSPNVKFVFSGHIEVPSYGKKWAVGYKRSVNLEGKYVYQMMANFQMYKNGGGYIRLVTVYPMSKRVEVTTYSPYLHDQLRGSRDRFTLENVNLGGLAPRQMPNAVVPDAAPDAAPDAVPDAAPDAVPDAAPDSVAARSRSGG